MDEIKSTTNRSLRELADASMDRGVEEVGQRGVEEFGQRRIIVISLFNPPNDIPSEGTLLEIFWHCMVCFVLKI